MLDAPEDFLEGLDSEGDKVTEKEELLMSPETIERIYDIHALLKNIHPVVMTELPQMKILLSTIANAQTAMATAANSMAATAEKAEQRYMRLEDRLQNANDKASGKGQIPIISHYLVLGGTVLITVLVVLYVHKQTIDASLTSIRVEGQR